MEKLHLKAMGVVLVATFASLVAPPAGFADETTATASPPASQHTIVWPEQSAKTDNWLMAQSARLQHMSGTVILSVVIGTDGRTSDIKVQTSSGKQKLDEDVAHAMEHYIYIPGTIDGQPVPMRVLISWHVDGMLNMAFPKILHP